MAGNGNPKSRANLKPPWPKGSSANPNGRPRLPEDLKAVKNFTREEIVKLVNFYLQKEPDELKKILSERKGTVMEILIASICYKGIIESDQTRLNFLLDRTIGKVMDKVEHTVRPMVIERPAGDQVVLTSETKKEEIED